MSISLSAHTQQRSTFKVVVVGERAVGKTSLAIRYVKGIFKEVYAVTVGIQFYSKVINGYDNDYNMQIWDTAGQQSFKSLIRSFYNQASCVVIAYSEPSQMNKSVESYLKEVQEFASQQVLVYVVRTKIDLKQVEQQEKIGLQQKMTNGTINGWKAVSSKEGININQFFQQISQNLMLKYQENEVFRNLVDARKITQSIVLSKQEHMVSTQQTTKSAPKKKKKCCES